MKSRKLEVKAKPRPKPGDDDEGFEVRPGAPGTSYYCASCSAWRTTLDCPVCGAELDDGLTGEGGLSPSFKAWATALWGEVLPSLPGGLLCFFVAWGALVQQMPFTAEGATWPGQLAATFVIAFWLLERTRAAHQHGEDLDPAHLAPGLLRALLVFPLLAGVASGHWAGLPVALVAAPLTPLLLGALVADDMRELSPGNLWAAFRATVGYFRIALVTALSIGLSTAVIWQVDGLSVWRALVATLGVTLAGSVVGIGRRGAEHTPEDD